MLHSCRDDNTSQTQSGGYQQSFKVARQLGSHAFLHAWGLSFPADVQQVSGGQESMCMCSLQGDYGGADDDVALMPEEAASMMPPTPARCG